MFSKSGYFRICLVWPYWTLWFHQYFKINEFQAKQAFENNPANGLLICIFNTLLADHHYHDNALFRKFHKAKLKTENNDWFIVIGVILISIFCLLLSNLPWECVPYTKFYLQISPKNLHLSVSQRHTQARSTNGTGSPGTRPNFKFLNATNNNSVQWLTSCRASQQQHFVYITHGSAVFVYLGAGTSKSPSLFLIFFASRRTVNFGTKLKSSPPPFLWFHLKDLPTHARTTKKNSNPRRRVEKRCETFHHPNHKIATCHSLDGVGKIQQQQKKKPMWSHR